MPIKRYERIITTTEKVLRIYLLPSLAGGHHTAYLTERGLVGADAHGWRQVDLFPATGYLSAGYGFGGVPLDRLDEGSSRGVDRQRHPGGGVEQYDAGRGATTGEATLRAGQDQIIVYLPGTDQDGAGRFRLPLGHDFRPEYTQLAILKERFPKVPVVALTATADKITRKDILEQLRLRTPQTFISSFDRPNISLTVRRGLNKKEKIAAIVHFIRGHREQSGIIYCMRRNDTTELADELAMYNIKAIAYHAGLLPAQREQAQNDFINDRVDVVCATVAFGMGIDKSNVRWVVHYSMPGSIENYYQEIGRAGRDGMKSDTLLFYSLSDLIVLRRFAEESGQSEVNLEKLNRMRRYCESDMCRRRVLLSYFGEEADHDCGNCDVCKNPPQRFDGSVLIQKALSAVIRTGEHVGMQMLIDILRASGRAELLERGYDKLKTYGAGRDLSYKEWKEYIYQMIQLGYMEIDYAAERVLRMTPLGRRVLYGEQKAQLVIYREPDELTRPVRRGERKSSFKAQPIRPIRSASTDETLLDSLRQLRKQIAEREHTPAYIIFSDDSLEDMVEKKPVTLDQFSDIRGVGQIKLDRYGKVFVALIRFVLKLPK